MIIINLRGGLGNQMFQYAMGRSLSLYNNMTLKLDALSYDNDVSHPFFKDTLRKYNLGSFNIIESFATIKEIKKYNINLFNKLFFHHSHKIIDEKSLNYQSSILRKYNSNIYMTGYWQNEKYFKNYQDILRKDFTFKHELSIKNSAILKKISASNSVSLHIRRGDYASSIHVQNVLGNLSMEYYQEAIELISGKITKPEFFVFSDGIEWVKKNLETDHVIHYVNPNTDCPSEDLRLMSLCKHNIIANSSFSWWGAWLNSNNSKVVVAPEKWFRNPVYSNQDIIPETWIKI